MGFKDGRRVYVCPYSDNGCFMGGGVDPLYYSLKC